MSKSKSRRKASRAGQPSAPRPSTRQASAGRAKSADPSPRKTASPAAIAGVAVAALLATAVLVALGEGIPSPNGFITASAASKGSGTAPAAGPEASAPEGDAASAASGAEDLEQPATTPEFEPKSVEAYASLETCAGKACPESGPPDAPVTIVEVSDFMCSHCRDFNQDSATAVDARFVQTGKVRYVAHVFGFSDVSQAIAAAAMCAHEQGRFFAYQSEAFRNQAEEPPSDAELQAWGAAVGLDGPAFEACVSEGRYLEDVVRSSDQALEAGITGTPSFIINGELIEGNPPLDMFNAQIEAALAAAGETS